MGWKRRGIRQKVNQARHHLFITNIDMNTLMQMEGPHQLLTLFKLPLKQLVKDD